MGLAAVRLPLAGWCPGVYLIAGACGIDGA
jgi:hypothetical protein